jgi:hypothetical protein
VGFKRKGRILRIRPGHLANFSGGAGYMPFIVIYSVPASILFGVVSSLVLYFFGKRILNMENGPKTGLYAYVRYARWHTLVCIAIAVVAGGILFSMANGMVYGNKMQYALLTAFLAVGPLVAWLISTIALALLIARRGTTWTNLLFATIIHVLLLAAGIPLAVLVSAITGA